MKSYVGVSNAKLAAMMRQFRKTRLELTCENGHRACGCSNVASMDGNAPCAQAVQMEIDKRKNAVLELD